jgi:hypothetical protein
MGMRDRVEASKGGWGLSRLLLKPGTADLENRVMSINHLVTLYKRTRLGPSDLQDPSLVVALDLATTYRIYELSINNWWIPNKTRIYCFAR